MKHKASKKEFGKAFTMRVKDEFFDDVDDLRAKERPLLSRSDFLRKLVDEKKREGAHK